MPNVLAHFAIEADNVARARAFYEAVFGWRFEAWGPPDFYLIHGAGVHGALQQRQQPLAPGSHGFVCTFAVDELDASAQKITAAGGELTGEPFTIPTIGRLIPFDDCEGNNAIIMQYDAVQIAAMGL